MLVRVFHKQYAASKAAIPATATSCTACWAHLQQPTQMHVDSRDTVATTAHHYAGALPAPSDPALPGHSDTPQALWSSWADCTVQKVHHLRQTFQTHAGQARPDVWPTCM